MNGAFCYSPPMNPNIVLPAAPASYTAHIEELSSRYSQALEFCKLDSITLHAGEQLPVFLDDQHYPHKPNPHLLQWLPLFGMADACLIVKAGQPPKLAILAAEDFWHAAPELPDESYLKHFEIEWHSQSEDYAKAVGKPGRRSAWIDPADSGRNINPDKLLNFLHYYRSVKTTYEIDCIREATRIAMPAHAAAKLAFEAGESGFGIHRAFMNAAGCAEHELPYPDIIACNENAATLHYERRTHEANPHSLLIDAGTMMNGYACDITRTYSKDPGFNELIAAMDSLQQSLCKEVPAGLSFGTAQRSAHLGIGQLLKAFGFVDMTPEAMVAEEVTNVFFPHGLGHMLGLQVHDVGGHMADASGKRQKPPAEHPNLRMSRTLEPGMVVTIEPGLYFIPMLLEKLRTSKHAAQVNFERIAEFARFGGIRIEDNVVIGDVHPFNITRDAAVAT